METIIIAAVSDNGVIGLDGDMPWHYPADLRHFERTLVDISHDEARMRRWKEKHLEWKSDGASSK